MIKLIMIKANKLLKTIFSICLTGIATLTAESVYQQYNEDFSINVVVPLSESVIVSKPQQINKDITAVEVIKHMGNGINLGNTMEAYRGWNKSTKYSPKYYEQLWGQPETTAEIMTAYRNAGFKTVRIPVAWTNMMNYEQGETTIAKALLDRVEQIVNYALDADLYVIINDHWDGQWWGMFGSSDKKQREFAVQMYKSIWKQIAFRFKNYSEKLIFESANEELGSRLNDETALSNKRRGTLSESQKYDATNKINQCFVDLIRATGGNNAYRFLLIAGFDTDIQRTISDQYKMPADTIKNKLIVSVHYYTPSTYCILSEDASWGKVKNSWGTAQDYEAMRSDFLKMKKFVGQGYGVIIGEYGVAFKKDGGLKDGTSAWLKNVIKLSEENNYCPVLWDCNGIFKKTGKLGFINDELANIYKEAGK